MNFFEQSVVRRDRFNEVFGKFPDSLDGTSAPVKGISWMDGEHELQQCAALDTSQSFDPALQPDTVQMFLQD